MKVSIIGTGHVGSTVAFSLVVKGLCDDIVLVNRTHRKAEGERKVDRLAACRGICPASYLDHGRAH